jgi:hypothetical protein
LAAGALPEINIKLFKRSDFRQLMAKYGLDDDQRAAWTGLDSQVMTITKRRRFDFSPKKSESGSCLCLFNHSPAISEVLLTEQQIQQRVRELGAAISADYAGWTRCWWVCCAGWCCSWPT